jgi:hypothetical protein
MPLNLLKKYNTLLDILGMDERQRTISLCGVFDRDITKNPNFKFQKKQINPTPADGVDNMDRLFIHLTTKIIGNERKREYDYARSVRLHWIRFHIEERKSDNILVFSVNEPDGIRTYIYDKDEEYVIVLEPLRKKNEYYLLTAYYVEGKDKARNKMKKKYGRKLSNVL